VAAFDATVGGVDSNSYATVLEADNYLASRVGSDAWTALADADKEIYLVSALYILDDRFDFVGIKTEVTQALQWPRYGLDDYADNVIPFKIKRAQIEIALKVITSGFLEAQTSLDSIKVGPINIDFDENSPDPMLPDHIRAIVNPLGSINSISSGGKGIQQVSLIR